jgi:RNA polymerase sigma-54 factor
VELKQYLKLSQQLVMTPQLQQAIKLLQLSRLELDEHVNEAMLENPVLEEIPESEAGAPESGDSSAENPDPGAERTTQESAQPSQDNAVTTTETSLPEGADTDLRGDPTENWEKFVENYQEFSNMNHAPTYTVRDDDRPPLESMLSSHGSLQDHLRDQLALSTFDEECTEIANRLIGNINENGYLSEGIIEHLTSETNVPDFTIEWVLEHIQRFDPLGVGARDLKECLQLQIEVLYPDNELLSTLVDRHLPDLEKRNYPAILRALKLTKEELAAGIDLISCLEPKPGRNFIADATQYVTPDVYIHKIADEFIVVLNEDGLPRLRISNFYRNTLQQQEGKSDTKNYIQDKFRSAVWLIRSIHQRQQTIRKVTESIVRFQTDFLNRGVEHLKPLILRDVADDIGMHESTVSRVTTNKYVHTPQGIFELKYFFNSRINSVAAGEDKASEAVKQMIKKLIDDEPSQKPLSDAKLVALLQNQNVDIARRTVAKYREALRIPSSSRRKRLL